jgi:putative ABC transport system substrate-binding protein
MTRLITLVIVFALGVVLGHPASAQQPAKVQRIGILDILAPKPATPRIPIEIIRKALADLGYVEGRNIVIEIRWPEDDRLDRLPEAAAVLVSLKPAVILAIGATAASAAKGATTDIPIVFGLVVDPVAYGQVANLDRPGGNVTGFTTFDPQQPRKQLEILKEAIPGLARVAILGDTGTASALIEAHEVAARALGLQIQPLKVERANPDFEGAFEAAKKQGAGAVIVFSTPVTSPNRKRIIELAIKHRLPTLSPRDHADAGGLISYGTGLSEAIRRTATYADKILKGAKPADLPVETLLQHELVINLKAARDLGLTIPPSILVKASQVVQ